MASSQILAYAINKFKLAKIKFPHLEAEILLSAILKKSREFLLAHGEKKLSKSQTTEYKRLIKRRLKGEPVAYLTGHKEFYGLDFIVNKKVLIPRPETELMIEETLKLISPVDALNSQLTTIIDVGTGSGCIIITLAKILNNKFKITNFNLSAIDISPKALTVARKNAQIHQVNKMIKFIKGNLLSPINDSLLVNNNPLIILANLPYGWKAWKSYFSPDTIGLKFEPQKAIFTGKNGLELYEKLFKQIKQSLIGHGSCREQKNLSVLCEFDPRQSKAFNNIIKKYLPQANVQIKKDLAGLNRLAIIKIK